MKVITSLQNPTLKSLVALRFAKQRRTTGTFLVEGAREIAKALAANYSLVTGLCCPSLFSDLGREVFTSLTKASADIDLLEVDTKCYNALVMRKDSDGVAAVFELRQHPLSAIKATPLPLILAVENVEKPGNLGAILRSADGAGVSAVVVLSSAAVDLYHPHCIRTSLGTVFSLPIAVCSNEEYQAYCLSHQVATYAACLSEKAEQFFAKDFRSSCSIIVGSEAWGLSAFWQKHCTGQVYIPMLGQADSLNVSVASGILLYEARRQRLTKP